MKSCTIVHNQPLSTNESLSRTSSAIFEQNKCTNLERVWTIFCHKTRVSTVLKNYKQQSFEYNDYKAAAYLTKATRRALTVLTKNTSISILLKFLDMFKITSIVYRPETCNLQTKIILFPD